MSYDGANPLRCFLNMGGDIKSWFKRSPSSRPSPPGEGEMLAAFLKNLRLDSRETLDKTKDRPSLFPLLGGEGQGEGGR
jgi:hypothetical protein